MRFWHCFADWLPATLKPQSIFLVVFFFSSRRRHTRSTRDWSSDVCSSDLSVTTTPCRIGLIGLGEVGQVLANDLHRVAGVEVGAWDRLFAVEGSEPRRAAR